MAANHIHRICSIGFDRMEWRIVDAAVQQSMDTFYIIRTHIFFIPMLYRNTISTAIRCAHKFIIHFKLFSSISLLIWFCRPISAIVTMIVSAAAQQMWSANNCSIASIYKFNINAWVLNVKQTQIQFADDLCGLWMLPNRPHNRDILAV